MRIVEIPYSRYAYRRREIESQRCGEKCKANKRDQHYQRYHSRHLSQKIEGRRRQQQQQLKQMHSHVSVKTIKFFDNFMMHDMLSRG